MLRSSQRVRERFTAAFFAWLAIGLAMGLATGLVGCEDDSGSAGAADAASTESSGSEGQETSGEEASEEEGGGTCDSPALGLDTELVVTPELAPTLTQCPADGDGVSARISTWAAKISTLQLGMGGVPGEGLDVDGDPETCAPNDDCSDGIDNQLGILANLANDGLAEALDDGSLLLTLELAGLVGPVASDTVIPLRMYTVYLAPLDEDCDWQSETCEYEVRDDSFDTSCGPLMEVDNATVDPDGQISAGGPDDSLVFSIPLFGVSVEIAAVGLRLDGELTYDCAGQPVGFRGLLAGAVLKEAFVGALDAIPAEEYEASGLDKDIIIGAADFLSNDIDTDDDGELDAVSVGLKFETIPGLVVGLTEANP